MMEPVCPSGDNCNVRSTEFYNESLMKIKWKFVLNLFKLPLGVTIHICLVLLLYIWN